MDWKEALATADEVKRKAAEADTAKRWKHYLPSPPTTEEDIELVETVLGFQLDDSYREFLKHANGWYSFIQAIDLFGTQDLVAGPRHDKAVDLLTRVFDLESVGGANYKETLLPIAVSRSHIDVIVIATPPSVRAGHIFWFVNRFLEQYESFEQFFLTIVDYNRPHDFVKEPNTPGQLRLAALQR